MQLRLAGCALGDAGCGPLVEALKGNTALRQLEMNGNALTAACTRDRLLPAVRANAGLRELGALNAGWGRMEGTVAAMEAVQARSTL
jgi:hypothetical protein